MQAIDEQEKKLNRIFWAIGFVIFLLHLAFLFWVQHIGWVTPPLIQEQMLEIIDAPDDEKFIEVDRSLRQEPPSTETRFFACADQSAAQMEPIPDERIPLPQQLQGEEDAHKILQGALEVSPPVLEIDPKLLENHADRDVVDVSVAPSIPEAVKAILPEKKDAEVFAVELVEKKEHFPEKQELEKLSDNPPVLVQSRPKPKPRPRVEIQRTATSGPLLKNPGSAARAGVEAVDARFSEYGEYLQKMSEVIYSQWMSLIHKMYPNLPRNCDIFIDFLLMPNGEVHGIQATPPTAPGLALSICRETVFSSAPFEPWTQAMCATLGEGGKEMKIHFSFR